MVVTRFAPSPTGLLHIGSARTALFAWLWAKNQKGKFILRIEDTDRERSTDVAVQVIIDGMKWLGLNWDEGPIYQTHRFDRYRAVAKQLLEKDLAYKCYCSKERLETLREQQTQNKEKPRYDGYCLRYPPVHSDDPYVIRFKTPQTGSIKFNDVIKGPIEIQNSELDDLIIMRSDGTPTYNFTVVVDDWDMKITHVLRGDDHINNTPRQIHILQALGANVPAYGHMPMLLGPDGKKLSKRAGAVSVLEYRTDGILPKALLNYLVRLGWSHGDREIFSIEEMCQLFNVKDINASASAINPEKLLWLNQHYIKTELAEALIGPLKEQLEALGINYKHADLNAIIMEQKDRCKTMVEMAQKSKFLFTDLIVEQPLIEQYFPEDICNALNQVLEKLRQVNSWNKESIHKAIEEVVTQLGLKLGFIAQPLRVAVTGSTVSPSIDATLYLLGKEKTIKRLEETLNQRRELAAEG